MNKLLLFLIVLLIIPLALAVPKDKTVFAGTDGFQIEFPEIVEIKQNTDYSFHFHVFNISNGVSITNTTASCYFHLYNDTGNHIYTESPVAIFDDDFDWEVNVGGGNFSRQGRYAYIFQCNNSELGGFVSVPLLVSESGQELTELTSINSKDSSAGIAIVIFILAIVGLLIVLPFKKDFAKNKFLDLILKRGCWSIAIYFMMFNSAIVATIANAANLDLTSEMFRYMWLWGTAGWLFLGFMFLKTLFDLIELWKSEAKKLRMGGDDGF